MNHTYLRVRSVADRILAGVLLILVSPVLVGVSISILVVMGRPILFRQSRVGMGGVIFSIFKFRTMVANAETLGGGYMPPEMNLIPPLGAFLRRTSLDEVPQLFNILGGDMAFIGPRPALPEQYGRYTPEQRTRVLVPQGVTGLAQVRFRNRAPWSKRIEADIEYVENLGFGLDVRILIRTLLKVLRSEDVALDQSPEEVDDLLKDPDPDPDPNTSREGDL